jgi:hypothetical protein
VNLNPLIVFELLLFNGVILAWAGYEFWSVRKRKADGTSPPPDKPGHTEG